MADEVTATAPAAPAAPEPASLPAGSAERAQAMIQKHVAATAALMAKEQEAESPAPEPEKPAEDKPAGRTRGKDGKFTAGERGSAGPHKPGEPGATPGPATEEKDKPKAEPEQEKPAPGMGLGRAQKLVREGNYGEALKLIGLDPEKLTAGNWAAWDKANKKAASQLGEAREAIERDRSELQQVARQAFEDVRPFLEARAAIQSQDYDKAFQLVFGQTWDDFQRDQVRRMANPGAGKDPAVVAMQRELAELKRREAERQQMTQQQQAAADLEARRQAKRNENVSELQSSGDERFEKACKQKAFMDEVWQVQGEHYDPRTDSTLPAVEAAEIAWERLQEEFGQWSYVFGSGKPEAESRVTGAKKPVAGVTGAATPVRRTAKSTSLNPSEAAEAAPAVKLKGQALMDYHVQKTMENLRNTG